MEVTFTKIYNRKKKLNKNGEAPVEICIYYEGKRTYVSTKVFISPIQWDSKRLEVNKKHRKATFLNAQIESLLEKFEKNKIQRLLDGKAFNNSILNELKSGNTTTSYYDFVKTELENDRNLRPRTKVAHQNTINKLKDFTQNKDLVFSELNYSFIDNFLNYLHDKGLAQNTIHKQHKNIKKFIDLAIKKGLYKNSNPCKDFKVKYVTKKREVLTLDEIKSIEELDLSAYEDNINVVRDMFLFACYTGLRISDATHLKREYVKQTKEGLELEFISIKVSKRVQLPLYRLFSSPNEKLSKPEIIITRYLNENTEIIFPALPESYINRHLKLIAELSGIKLNLTFHVARHSFGTFMASKIPLPTLMVLMQHSDIKTTMVYVNISQEMVKQGLLNVNWE